MAQTTRAWRVYGMDGHRQKASFGESSVFTTWDGVDVAVMREDRTGTNDYVVALITAKDGETCESKLWSQVSDGVFEDCHAGKVEEIPTNKFFPYSRPEICIAVLEYFANLTERINAMTERFDGDPDVDLAIISALGEGEHEWNAAPCDPEGPTKEQDAALDKIIDDTVDVIIDVLNAHGITVAAQKAGV